MSLPYAKQPLHFRGTASEAEPALIGLAGRNQLSPYVRDVLQALLDLCNCGLELRISEALNEFEKQLVRLADKATIHQQNEYFGSVHALQHGRADVVPRFLRSIENSLAQLGEDIKPSFNARSTKSTALNLALTDSIQMDESVVLSDIATKVEMRVREPLFALGRRFGALIGAPPLAVENLPLGPRAIVEALRYGASSLDLIDEHRLVLYRCFERVVMNQIGSLYIVLNNCLIERGVLPNLHTLTTGNGIADTTFPRSTAKLPANDAPPANGRGGDARTTPASAGARPIAVPIRLARNDFFGTLRQLLGECRRAESYAATGDDLQAVLIALQACQPVASIVEGTSPLRSADDIKHEILVLLQERCAQGRTPRISEEDSDAIDLTAMLFDFLSRQARPNGVANRILVKLQLPILRAAIKDKSFFSDETHYARRLLNEFVEAAQFWIDENEGPTETALVDKLQQLTDHIACAYQGDAAAFATASEALSQHIAELMLRGEEAAEQSLMEVAAARKKRASEELAAAAIGERIARARPNEFLRALLECVWTDVLVVALLRDGEDSAGYQRRLEVVDQLLAAASAKGSGCAESLAPDMRAEIESGLAQVNLSDDDIRAITKRLFARDDDQQENPISQTELAIKLKARRWGSQKAAPESLKGRASEIEALQKLAREVANRQARIKSGEQESLVDKAWISIRDTLSNFSGRKQASLNPTPLWTARRPDQTLRPPTVQKTPPQPQEARTLLLVDDEVSITRALTRVLRADGYRILSAASAAEAMEMLSLHDVQVIIADQRMPHVSGTQFLTEAKAIRPNTVRILLSGYSDAVSVMDAINRGTIYKFLTKPWDDDDIRLQVRDAFQTCELL